MNLLVLRVSDLEASRAFYASLGLQLVPEQHGDGPLHYSCTMDRTVLELYPSTPTAPPTKSLRLGFRIARAALSRLDHPTRLSRAVETYLVRDPDENAIELQIE